jgi:hypothetical protein
MIRLDNKFTTQFSANEQVLMLQLLLGADDDGVVRISYRTSSKACGMTLQVFRTILSSLIKKGEIEKETSTTGTFIIICNYDTYRIGKKKTSQQATQTVIRTLQAKCKEREKIFGNSLVPFVVTRGGIYQPQMIRTFFNYWTEKNKLGTKMRFELEKTWETSKRLITWANRDKQIPKSNSSTVLKSSEMNYENDW